MGVNLKNGKALEISELSKVRSPPCGIGPNLFVLIILELELDSLINKEAISLKDVTSPVVALSSPVLL